MSNETVFNTVGGQIKIFYIALKTWKFSTTIVQVLSH